MSNEEAVFHGVKYFCLRMKVFHFLSAMLI